MRGDPQVVVVLVTGWSVEVDDKRMKESGADMLLSKPFRIEDAHAILENAVKLRMGRLRKKKNH
jgi:DNA-binding response OmpR family regulator